MEGKGADADMEGDWVEWVRVGVWMWAVKAASMATSSSSATAILMFQEAPGNGCARSVSSIAVARLTLSTVSPGEKCRAAARPRMVGDGAGAERDGGEVGCDES